MTDCEKCREMISCLLDGELSDAQCSLVREHIAGLPRVQKRVRRVLRDIGANARARAPARGTAR